jgi:hypothetical protein
MNSPFVSVILPVYNGARFIVEEIITGKQINSDTVEKAVSVVMKTAQPLEKNGYKIPLFKGILEEELLSSPEMDTTSQISKLT